MEILFIIFFLWVGWKLIKWAFIVLAYAVVFITYGSIVIYESVKNKENVEQLIARLKNVNKVPVQEYKEPRKQGIDPRDFDDN
jgi:predicted membrane protein